MARVRASRACKWCSVRVRLCVLQCACANARARVRVPMRARDSACKPRATHLLHQLPLKRESEQAPRALHSQRRRAARAVVTTQLTRLRGPICRERRGGVLDEEDPPAGDRHCRGRVPVAGYGHARARGGIARWWRRDAGLWGCVGKTVQSVEASARHRWGWGCVAAGTYGEIWGDMGRYGEIWGEMGRDGEMG